MFRPKADSFSALPYISETSFVSQLAAYVKPEDELPSIPSSVPVICNDSAVDIPVKDEDGLPSQILRSPGL